MRLQAATIFTFIFFLLVCANASAQSKSTCHDIAKSDYEKLFCTLQDKGAGNQLPTFSSFRANTPQLQSIILKRPAQKLGITVPPPAASAPKPTTAVATPNQKPEIQPQAAASVPSPVVARAPEAARSKPAANSMNLGSCELHQSSIHCSGNTYKLIQNQANNKLAPGALSPDNRFGLENYRGNRGDKSALNRYLADSYRHYIEKMLHIGLGAATMSYTKFYYTYEQLAEKNEDFAQRFELMYDYLKKDKASMAVKAAYHQQLPDSIQLCQDLSSTIVVCDNGELNWVYLKSN